MQTVPEMVPEQKPGQSAGALFASRLKNLAQERGIVWPFKTGAAAPSPR